MPTPETTKKHVKKIKPLICLKQEPTSLHQYESTRPMQQSCAHGGTTWRLRLSAALRLLLRSNTQSLKHQGLQGCQQEFHRAHRSKATSPSTNPEQGASIRCLAKGFEFMIQSIKLTTSRNRTYQTHA